MLSDYAPLLIYTVIVIGVVGLLLTLSNLLGPRKPYLSKLLPYESGIVPETPSIEQGRNHLYQFRNVVNIYNSFCR